MIKLQNVSRAILDSKDNHRVFTDINLNIPKICIGVISDDDAAENLLLRLLAGVYNPKEGLVTNSKYSVSWPIGDNTIFEPKLTVIQNIEFIFNIYGFSDTESKALVDSVRQYEGLNDLLTESYKHLNRQEKRFLEIAVLMQLDFDYYLFNTFPQFNNYKVYKQYFKSWLKNIKNKSGVIICTQNFKILKKYCDAAIVVDDSQMYYYDNVKEAVSKNKSIVNNISSKRKSSKNKSKKKQARQNAEIKMRTIETSRPTVKRKQLLLKPKEGDISKEQHEARLRFTKKRVMAKKKLKPKDNDLV